LTAYLYPLGQVAAEYDFISISIHPLVKKNIPPSWVELQDV
jgi:hypothetical protein